jgi:hypothetical protein
MDPEIALKDSRFIEPVTRDKSSVPDTYRVKKNELCQITSEIIIGIKLDQVNIATK